MESLKDHIERLPICTKAQKKRGSSGKKPGGKGSGKGGLRRETEDTSQNSPSACWHQPCDTLESCTSTYNPLEMEQAY